VTLNLFCQPNGHNVRILVNSDPMYKGHSLLHCFVFYPKKKNSGYSFLFLSTPHPPPTTVTGVAVFIDTLDEFSAWVIDILFQQDGEPSRFYMQIGTSGSKVSTEYDWQRQPCHYVISFP
jgi:hypothetical protein